MNTNESNLIIYNTVDGRASVVLYARDGSVWMNQNQLAELFDTSKPNISMHISNILNEKELEFDSVVKNYLTTAADGKQFATIRDNARLILCQICTIFVVKYIKMHFLPSKFACFKKKH